MAIENCSDRPQRRRLAPLLHCGLPVSVGAYVYLAYRSTTLLAYQALARLGLGAALAGLREHAPKLLAPLERELLFTLPDGLWVYALTACMILIWGRRNAGLPSPWILVGFVLGAGGEVGQRVGLVPDTFDILDLAAIILGFAGAVLLTPQTDHNEKTPLLATGADCVRIPGSWKRGRRFLARNA